MAKQKQDEIKTDEPEVEPEPVAAKPAGVTFWPRMRVYTDGPPTYYDRVEMVPANLRPLVETAEADFLGIEYPLGSGRHLQINGAKRIADRDIVLHLITTGKASPIGAGGKSGVLLFDPADLAESGYCSPEKAKRMIAERIHPDADVTDFIAPPAAPPPNWSMLREPELDQYASEHDVRSLVEYQNIWPKARKEAALAAWHRRKAQGVAK